VTAFDAWIFRRALALAAVLFAVGAAVDRLARIGATSIDAAIGVAPLGPVIAAVAVAWTIENAVKNGAIGAIEALGVAPVRARSGAIGAGLFVGLFAASTIALPSSEVSALFPSAPRSTVWQAADGASGLRFFAASEGVAIDARGGLVAIDRVVSPDVAPIAHAAPPLRHAGGLALAMATIGLCLLAAMDRKNAYFRASIAIAFSLAQIVAFIAVGAGRVGVAATWAPSLLLVAVASAMAAHSSSTGVAVTPRRPA
jgi:hypothetical protein